MPYPPNPPSNGFTFTRTTHPDTYPAIDSATKSDCTNKSVLITGASKGIGRATALSYAKAGASHIALAARSISHLSTLKDEILSYCKSNSKSAPQILELSLDVTSLESVEKAAKEIEAQFGRLDILINNAGYLEEFVPIVDSDPSEWWKTWEVNVRGVYYVTKAFLPLLLKGGDKTVVNLSSIGAFGIRPGASGYQTTKLAILKFTEFIMVEYADQGVLAYAVHPGGVLTELASNMPKETHSTLLTDKAEVASDTIVFLTQTRREWLAGRYISCVWDMPEFLSREEEIVKGDKLKVRLVV